jgi:SM-20-related protein
MQPPIVWPDLFVVEQFFEADRCAKIVADMLASEGDAAVVYGHNESGSLAANTRRTLRLRPSPETIDLVTTRLAECRKEVAKHFEVELTEYESPQFLRYRTGDFFVAHQDGNTGLLRLETERRKVSAIIFLSREASAPQPGTHCGGSLVFTDLKMQFDKYCLSAEPGTLVAFRSETTHEVTPLTHGERLSIASWYW